MTTNHDDTDAEAEASTDGETERTDGDETTANDGRAARTPGGGTAPEPEPIEPAAPAEFGLVQAWWVDGKGKTTAAMGMGFRAAGHGYRVHMLQFMKGGADSVEGVRGEYNAIAAVPGFSYENAGHYGWHGLLDGSADDEHEAKAAAAFERAEALVAGAADADLSEPLPLDGEPEEEGVHMLILDELLYAADRGLVDPDDVVALAESKPEDLELVLTGSHAEPEYLDGVADLITNVRKVAHPFDDGQRARRGTEY
ncbi:cob(I)yrinic acid a,c-diamide adenosyltransferase [Halorubrum trapanicum]|uniref:cob(I)yrinic acid a,c-diamide adenosyltransferase n=1 Tax=Halorubrum trapanicum TaxID=29284 RepID=UPI003C6FE9B9